MKVILGVVVVLVALLVGGQIVLAEWSYYQFRDEVRDLAGNAGENIGLVVPRSDEELRKLVVGKAEGHGIQLDPRQFAIHYGGTREWPTYELAADYDAPVKLPGYAFSLRFSVSSGKK